jgi:hypothetical protein
MHIERQTGKRDMEGTVCLKEGVGRGVDIRRRKARERGRTNRRMMRKNGERGIHIRRNRGKTMKMKMSGRERTRRGIMSGSGRIRSV